MAKQYRFVLLEGAHSDLLNHVLYQYVPGKMTVVPSNHRLDIIHPTKFRLLDRKDDPLAVPDDGTNDLVQKMGFNPVQVPPLLNGDKTVVDSPYIIDDEPADLSAVPAQPVVDYGTEVTDQCPNAVQHRLRVFRRKGRLFVTLQDNPKEIVCAEGGYTGLAAVAKAIDKYTETHHTAPA